MAIGRVAIRVLGGLGKVTSVHRDGGRPVATIETNTGGRKMRSHPFLALSAMLGVSLLVSFVAPVEAVTVKRSFNLATPNGTPVTHLAIYAAGDGKDAVVLSPTPLPASGSASLGYTVDFTPKGALAVGLSQRKGEEKWDIVMFTNKTFADAAVGKRFDVAFPDFGNAHRLGHLHANLPAILQKAHAGDPASLQSLTEILREENAKRAYFDPYGDYRIVHWTAGSVIPEPATLALLAFGIAGLAVARQRRRS